MSFKKTVTKILCYLRGRTCKKKNIRIKGKKYFKWESVHIFFFQFRAKNSRISENYNKKKTYMPINGNTILATIPLYYISNYQ